MRPRSDHAGLRGRLGAVIGSALLVAPGALTADAVAARPAAAAPATAICGQTSTTGDTPVTDAKLGVRFVMPNYWLCVPGTGPLPATVLVAERIGGPEITTIVAELRRSSVGGFYLLPGAKIPCEVAVDEGGSGTLPDAATWSQEISDEARADGATIGGLSVSVAAQPGGRFLDATFTESNPGGATFFIDEYLASVGSKLVVTAFQGSPSWHDTIVGQARLIMGSFR